MSWIPPCTPVLCTLHNHPLLSLAVHLNSFSLTHSHSSFSDTPSSSSRFFGSNPGHRSFTPPSIPSSLPPIPNLESWSSWSPCLSHSLCVFVFFLLSSCNLSSTPFPFLSLLISLSLPPALHSPSGLIRLEGGCLVCMCMCVLLGKVSLDWACHLH